MSRTTALQAFLVGAPLAFAALLTQHPTGTGDFYAAVSSNLTAWLGVHFGAAVLFPAMALVIWLLIRDVSGRAATVARFALPVYVVFYGVFESDHGHRDRHRRPHRQRPRRRRATGRRRSRQRHPHLADRR